MCCQGHATLCHEPTVKSHKLKSKSNSDGGSYQKDLSTPRSIAKALSGCPSLASFFVVAISLEKALLWARGWC